MSIAGTVLMTIGVVLMAITALGLLRLPDFFSRLHSVSKSETLGIALLLLGLMFHEGGTLVSLKLGLILLFVTIANPVAAHVLSRAAVRTGLLPWRRDEEGGA